MCGSAERRGWLIMRILVTSASGANGDGYGAILAFDPVGRARLPEQRR
jgi:hypothetical protein